MTIRFGSTSCADLAFSERREWLVTNGLGGYACGTVAGVLTRRYHGLLVAATSPPAGRTLLVPKVDESVTYDGRAYALGANGWADGTVDPRGFTSIESFRLDGTAPVWRYAFADAILEKRIWMKRGANITFVRYEVARASAPVDLSITLFIDGRDHHGSTRASGAPPTLEPSHGGFRFATAPGAPAGWAMSDAIAWVLDGSWYYGFDLARERERGLDARDDHICAAHGSITLAQGAGCAIALGAESETPAAPEDDEWEAFAARERDVASALRATQTAGSDEPWIDRLGLAAHQFIVKRGEGDTVIAGYPWFTDWGRDTMISLPGLTLGSGRFDVARSVLRTFARFVDRGMIPNQFPDTGGAPEYNTVDATLWYILAIERCASSAQDAAFAREMLPVVDTIVDWHVRGTRHGIKMDETDGLLAAGEAGVQLTWMDAKVGDNVITPRIGKPVEVNALWVNALAAAGRLAMTTAGSPAKFDGLAANARAGFERFWRQDLGFCVDVLDGPDGADASLRPNQIFAISLPEPLLDETRMRKVVDACGRALLTSYGLRTLAPSDPRYAGRYEGDPSRRDGAYHQGTVWPWLLGPYAIAHYRAYGDARAARMLLAPLEDALFAYGLGQIPEVFDGDAPHAPGGCIAQAWSVAQTLEAWMTLAAQRRP
ncbi:MAG TPA: amylo-alpha-1,6-glucosidase [Candidatus Eremiobacteraceae bacterium]|nr:amylo-alpha-1,6-glucosidase [Candidatus Eremiobacteraceae bacterium]